MTSPPQSDDHVARNRAAWNVEAAEYVDPGRRNWSEEPSWGIWSVPERDVHLLDNVEGLDVIELGCGTGYVSAWLARRGARPVGIDMSENQLATARALPDEHDLHFPLIQGNAEATPALTWRSASTAPRSGATRISGFRRPRDSSVPGDARSSSATARC